MDIEDKVKSILLISCNDFGNIYNLAYLLSNLQIYANNNSSFRTFWTKSGD